MVCCMLFDSLAGYIDQNSMFYCKLHIFDLFRVWIGLDIYCWQVDPIDVHVLESEWTCKDVRILLMFQANWAQTTFTAIVYAWIQFVYSNPGLISASNQCHPRPTSFNLKDLEAPTGLLDLWTMCASLLLTCFPFFSNVTWRHTQTKRIYRDSLFF